MHGAPLRERYRESNRRETEERKIRAERKERPLKMKSSPAVATHVSRICSES